jgi:glycosyltransferase involved in cell wall biosynthesis
MPRAAVPELSRRSDLSPGSAASPAAAEWLSGLPQVRALMSMPCAVSGVGSTCRSLLASAARAGFPVRLDTSRFDGAPDPALAVHAVLGPAFGRVPFWAARKVTRHVLHQRFLSSVRPDEVAYLWPSVPVSVYRALKARGIPLVAEAINTRMAVARPILDRAYAQLGLPPSHGITDHRIAEQAERYALADYIFAPSPGTAAALSDPAITARILPSSYGVTVPATLPDRRPRAGSDPVTFLFVGQQSVRKGLQTVLEAWKSAPPNARLRIVGGIESSLVRLYRDVLNLPSVTSPGFAANVAAHYLAADVFLFPSLEEGDALVTYEAAAHGLPIVATAVGAGRFGAETGAYAEVPALDPAALADRIAAFAASDDLRRDLGQRARTAVLPYDWSLVGPRTFRTLHDHLSAEGFAL